MAPMRCSEFWQFSSEWMEGQRKPAAVSHLADCPGCRALIADLEMIRRASALLPEEEPPARIWSAIKSQLEKEGVIRAPKTSWRERFATFGAFRPAMAGAYLSLIIAGAILLGGHLKTTNRAAQRALWLQSTQKNTMPLAAELSKAERKSLPMLQARDNDVTATLNRNLAIVDNMISVCEKGVRQDPQNEMMRDYLYTAYQQKADLLATVADSEGR
jgi:hypothetical protein